MEGARGPSAGGDDHPRPAPDAGPVPDRDRDAGGRARNARPRDGLGRPLPYGSPGVARQPEGVRRTPAETLAEAQRLLDGGMPFHAHEVFEDAWKASAGPDRGLWRGLAQLAVGLTHAARGNPSGAAALLGRAADALAPYGADAPHGVPAAALAAWARRAAAAGGTADGAPPRLPAHPGGAPDASGVGERAAAPGPRDRRPQDGARPDGT
ncbi:DUF309 domain-containing protein [Streptacidiphilus sp. ASG 303]|nr:DUF309 domain-containing protein [Streptacidiphilus sp. ASG 303]MCD0483421.1 DUF309 domain-containing protein [Streptacidiphilus sp. ASG 303]